LSNIKLLLLCRWQKREAWVRGRFCGRKSATQLSAALGKSRKISVIFLLIPANQFDKYAAALWESAGQPSIDHFARK
jgi:hypothetical protein